MKSDSAGNHCPLVADLEREIERVTAKAARWMARAKTMRPRYAFVRPAKAMLKDVAEAKEALASGDPYAMAVAVGELREYHDDD